MKVSPQNALFLSISKIFLPQKFPAIYTAIIDIYLPALLGTEQLELAAEMPATVGEESSH
jgi:hypothetical protein